MSRSLRVVIAVDSFKGSLSASDAARAIAEGWRSVRPGDAVRSIPQADGGEGTIAALHNAHAGSTLHRVHGVTGPDGRPVDGEWLELPDGTAVVEVASASGLPLMASSDALGATSRGTGELLAAALDAGAGALVVGLGGSAMTDGGSGTLRALGARFLDAEGRELPDGGAALRHLTHVDLTGLRPLPAGGLRLLSDVRAPLLGPRGAAAVFGPQKGADAAQVTQLDAALRRLAELLGGDPERPGAGAAGGTGFGLTRWGGRLESGAEAVAVLSGLPTALADADLMITGEGRVDATSDEGKSCGHSCALADAAGVPSLVIAGSVDRSSEAGVTARRPSVSLTEIAGSAERAMAEPARWLRRAAAQVAESAERFDTATPTF